MLLRYWGPVHSISKKSARTVILLSVGCIGYSAFPAEPGAQGPSSPVTIGNVVVNVSLRSRLYFWDWFQPAAGNNDYQYSGTLLRIGFSQKRDTWDWNAEFAVPFLFGLPGNAVGTGPQQGTLGLGPNYVLANSGSQNTAMIFPKQLYLRFDGIGGNRAHTLQLGRFEFFDGSEIIPENATLATVKRERVVQRLIGNFTFSDVGRSLDGVRYAYSTPSSQFTFVGGAITRGVFQVDGWGWNRASLGYTSYTREWGKGRHAADTRLFFIEYDDFRHILKTDNRALATRRSDLGNIRIDTFGGHTLHAFETSAGVWDFLLWGAVQTGRWGVQAHRAYAFLMDGGFQPPILPRIRPWLRGGFSSGSGDSNPNDGTHQTFFQLLPSPRACARFPFFNMMNMEDRYGTLLVRPHGRITPSVEFHALRLQNVNDLWYAGGGVFQPWTFGFIGRATSGRRSLANLYDGNLEFRANQRLTLTGYLGYAQGLAVMQQIYPRGTHSSLGFVELLYRF